MNSKNCSIQKIEDITTSHYSKENKAVTTVNTGSTGISCSSTTNDIQEIEVRITSRYNKANRKVSATSKASTRNMSNLIKIKRTTADYKATFSKQLSVCSLNPGSVKNKTQSLCDFITTHDFDIVALTETWLHKCTDKQIINEIVPVGFEMKHVPRPNSRKGGGVAIIFKSTISVKVLDSTDIPEKGIPGLEFMECKIKIKKAHVL